MKWETTLTRNLAADITLFDNRLTITPEFYWNTTSDLFYKSDVATTSGYASQMRNIGQVTNKGIELTINYDFLRGKDYVFSGNVTFGMNKMVVDKLNETDDVIWDQNDRWKSSYNDYCLKVGDQVGLIYGLFTTDFTAPMNLTSIRTRTSSQCQRLRCLTQTEKLVSGTVINKVLNDSQSGVATLPGKIKFKDLNGDGVIDENDRTVIGNTNPKFQGGFGLSGQWKSLDFTANFTYMLDFDINNATAYALSSSTKQFHIL